MSKSTSRFLSAVPLHGALPLTYDNEILFANNVLWG